MSRSVHVDPSVNLYGLEAAPIFRPTEEEFLDPFKYIESIRPQAEKAGICKIIPPHNWKPSFSVDQDVRGSFFHCVWMGQTTFRTWK